MTDDQPGHRLPLPGRAGRSSTIDKTAEYQTFEDALGDLIARHLEIDGRDAIISAMELQIMAVKEEGYG